MQTVAIVLAASLLLVMGFALGFLTREWISRRRRARLAEMEMLWGGGAQVPAQFRNGHAGA